jgi:hypothetical protein
LRVAQGRRINRKLAKKLPTPAIERMIAAKEGKCGLPMIGKGVLNQPKHGDRHLRLPVRCGNGGKQPAAKLIARSPGLPAGVLLIQGHGSHLPGDQGVQRFGRNEGPPADARYAKATSSNVIVECRPAQTGNRASFSDTVGKFLDMVDVRLHGMPPDENEHLN